MDANQFRLVPSPKHMNLLDIYSLTTLLLMALDPDSAEEARLNWGHMPLITWVIHPCAQLRCNSTHTCNSRQHLALFCLTHKSRPPTLTPQKKGFSRKSILRSEYFRIGFRYGFVCRSINPLFISMVLKRITQKQHSAFP
jgi:hypothetical protein